MSDSDSDDSGFLALDDVQVVPGAPCPSHDLVECTVCNYYYNRNYEGQKYKVYCHGDEECLGCPACEGIGASDSDWFINDL